jgi:peptidyl-tRNA hydrolase, PTH1 family
MRIAVGLGNPGDKYLDTRHNVGFVCVETLRTVLGAPAWQSVGKTQSLVSKTTDWLLIQPQAFMNQSGLAVRGVFDFYLKFGSLSEPEKLRLLKDCFVAHDDLDLQLGKSKVQFGRGPKIHNGLLSLYNHLGSEQFWHVRLGIDGRLPSQRIAGREYVLQQFLPTERICIDQVIKDSLQRILS